MVDGDFQRWRDIVKKTPESVNFFNLTNYL